MPLIGISPSIAAILINAWIANHVKTPATINWLVLSGALCIIVKMRKSKAPYIANKTTDPIKPNFSAKIAKIESFSASGKDP